MQLITPDLDCHRWIGGTRFRELTAKEVRDLPEDAAIFVAILDQEGRICALEKYSLEYRYKRPVLYRMPFRDTFFNIGTYAGRMYLIPN